MDIENIVREYITKTVHMSLATVNDNIPWVCEVHFTYDDNLNLYFLSLKSRRHSQEIAENPNVAGNIIDKHALGQPVVGLYFEGTCQIIRDNNQKKEVFKYFRQNLNARENILEESDHEDGHQFYKITVRNWYVFGKFDTPTGQKYKLAWNGGEK